MSNHTVCICLYIHDVCTCYQFCTSIYSGVDIAAIVVPVVFLCALLCIVLGIIIFIIYKCHKSRAEQVTLPTKSTDPRPSVAVEKQSTEDTSDRILVQPHSLQFIKESVCLVALCGHIIIMIPTKVMRACQSICTYAVQVNCWPYVHTMLRLKSCLEASERNHHSCLLLNMV